MLKRTVTERISIGDQPTDADLEGLRREGYVGVVNLRHDGEPEQPLSTAAEGEVVQKLGMAYLRYPVGGAPLTAEGVQSVCDFIDQHAAGKVMVHCRKGGRAAALVLLQQARLHGWSPAEVHAKGKAMGLEVEGGLKTLVEQYLASPK
jgi:uncharacterized protein (TIGR01244 family)